MRISPQAETWNNAFAAAKRGHLEVLQLLSDKLDPKDDLDLDNHDLDNVTLIVGNNLIQTAAYYGHTHIVKWLLETFKCDFSNRNIWGNEILHTIVAGW